MPRTSAISLGVRSAHATSSSTSRSSTRSAAIADASRALTAPASARAAATALKSSDDTTPCRAHARSRRTSDRACRRTRLDATPYSHARAPARVGSNV
nr:hypothetical protein GCM10017745_33960 [Saccharothrix mutabilis subsp. capreolus]